MSRVNTVTSLLKRFLSKEDSQSRPGSASTTVNAEKGLGTSASSASIAGRSYPQQIGSMKIADQVIEEVDEQMTITSLRNKEEPRPTAQSIFSPPSSDPVDVPGRVPPPYQRFYSAQVHEEDSSIFPPGGIDDFLSASAPPGKMPTSSSHLPNTMSEFDPKQFDSQDSNKVEETEELDSTVVDDEFERLRQDREAARMARQKEKIARSISAQQGIVNQIELQELLTEALANNPVKSESGDSSPTQEAT
jgi:bestrophin, other